MFTKWHRAAKLSKTYKKNDILGPGEEEYLPHVRMALAPRNQNEEKELLSHHVAQVVLRHAYAFVR